MNSTMTESRVVNIAQALRDPACYPHPVDKVEVVETHISWVFLAGEYAYKVKKPVRLPFLDFSTLSERYYYCLDEVRLNQRTAPQIYLDVVPIGGTPPRVGQSLPLIEYAVRMRRFPQDAVFEQRAREARLAPWDVDALADTVARFHGSVSLPQAASDLGSADRVCTPAEQNFDEIAALDPEAAASPGFESLREWTRLACHDLAHVFTARRNAGFVRECHGDLHLGNVILLDGRPVLFDCIEFSAGLRWTDTMNDVAFLHMDLFAHGLGRLAWRFLDRYLEASGDYGGLAVLRFYSVYRAMVRAKIAAVRRHQLEPGTPPWRASQATYERYLALAERLAKREPPVLVLMHGLAASGKTTASQRLLEALGAVRLRSDVERKRLHGLDALARTGAAPGEGIYGADETDRTYERLENLALQALEAGYPVVVDATFIDSGRRDRFREIAREARAAFEIVSCEAPADVLRERVQRRLRNGKDASDAGIAVLERQIAGREPLSDEERVHATFLDTTSTVQWHAALESFARRFRLPMERV